MSAGAVILFDAPTSAVRHVRQSDAYGCGVASLAMVTGHRYEDVRAWFRVPAFLNAERAGRGASLVGDARNAAEPRDFSRHGIDHFDTNRYLAEHGFASALRWPTPRYGDTRPAWPPAPFAPAHICQVLTVNGGHAVVWLPDGTVLDPARDAPTTLDDPCYYGGLQWVLGVWRMGGL